MARAIFFLFCFAGLNLLGAQTFVIKPDSESGKDAEIWSYQTATTDGGVRESSNVFTWTMGGSLAVKRSLMEFNLAALPSVENLIDARLNLYYNPIDRYESVDGHSGENSIYIERIISEWEEHEVYWGNQPGTTPENRVALPTSQTSYQDYINVNVTALVKDMLNDLEDSHGFMIRMQDEFNPYSMCILASSDHPNPELHPSLVLTFDEVQQVSAEKLDLIIYPNPVFKETNENIYIPNAMTRKQNSKYRIIGESGQLMKEGILPSQGNAVSLSGLDSGLYFLVVEYGEKKVYVAKVLVL